MVNRNYQHGRAYEYRVKKKLEAEGWTVLRSAGSHGFADLIAIKCEEGKTDHCERCQCDYYDENEGPRKEIKLIQCKTGTSAKREIRKVEQSDIKRFEGLYSVSVEVV